MYVPPSGARADVERTWSASELGWRFADGRGVSGGCRGRVSAGVSAGVERLLQGCCQVGGGLGCRARGLAERGACPPLASASGIWAENGDIWAHFGASGRILGVSWGVVRVMGFRAHLGASERVGY